MRTGHSGPLRIWGAAEQPLGWRRYTHSGRTTAHHGRQAGACSQRLRRASGAATAGVCCRSEAGLRPSAAYCSATPRPAGFRASGLPDRQECSLNYKAVVAYDGTGFNGYQMQVGQPGTATIQDCLERALTCISQQPRRVRLPPPPPPPPTSRFLFALSTHNKE